MKNTLFQSDSPFRLFLSVFLPVAGIALLGSYVLALLVSHLNEDQEVLIQLGLLPLCIGISFMLLLFLYQRLSKKHLPPRFVVRYALPGFVLPLIMAMVVAQSMPTAYRPDGTFDQLNHLTRFFFSTWMTTLGLGALLVGVMIWSWGRSKEPRDNHPFHR
jgi:RsiW-degrading membrane proteinase PrsW (M82 family)